MATTVKTTRKTTRKSKVSGNTPIEKVIPEVAKLAYALAYEMPNFDNVNAMLNAGTKPVINTAVTVDKVYVRNTDMALAVVSKANNDNDKQHYSSDGINRTMSKMQFMGVYGISHEFIMDIARRVQDATNKGATFFKKGHDYHGKKSTPFPRDITNEALAFASEAGIDLASDNITLKKEQTTKLLDRVFKAYITKGQNPAAGYSKFIFDNWIMSKA